MAKRKCNRCNVAKSKDEYYNREGTCKECRKQRKKELYHGKISDNEYEESLDSTMELDIVQNLEIKLRCEMNEIVAALRKDTANLENAIQKMHEKIGLISEENMILHKKVGKLEIENAKLHSIVETNQHGMDCMDENILRNVSLLHEKVGILEIENTKIHSIIETKQLCMDSMKDNILRNVSMSEDLCVKTRELDELVKETHTLQDKIGNKLNRTCKMLLEVGDTYYQFIVGNSTKYDVRKRLHDVGYLETKKTG